MNVKSAASRMRKEYGEKYGEYCRFCCNHQRKSEHDRAMVCIAFSCELCWDANEKACGLFNTAFRGIRPRRMPLEEYLNKSKKAKEKNSEGEGQTSIFEPETTETREEGLN